MINSRLIIASDKKERIDILKNVVESMEFAVGNKTKKIEISDLSLFELDSPVTVKNFSNFIAGTKEHAAAVIDITVGDWTRESLEIFLKEAKCGDITLEILLIFNEEKEWLSEIDYNLKSDTGWLILVSPSSTVLKRTLRYMLSSWNREYREERFIKQLYNEIENQQKYSSDMSNMTLEVIKNLDRKSSFIRHLFSITENLSVQVELEGFLSSLVDFIAKVLDAKRVSVMVKEGEYLKIKAAVGLPENALNEIYLGDGISGKVFETNKPVLAKHLDQSANISRGGWSSSTSYISCPIALTKKSGSDNPSGVINVTDKKDGLPFNEEDLELLTFISHLASIAINNRF